LPAVSEGETEAPAELRTRVCHFALDPRGFVRATMADGARFDLDDAVQSVDAMFRVGLSQARPVLVDMRGLREQTREARTYFAGEEAARRMRAVALWIGSPVSRMIGNFFLGVGVQRTPSKLFTVEDEAIAWLARYVP
jgi:hypothetical protein